jgi:hypothetical protein
MSRKCPACSKINPQDAFFCYFDGRLLSNENHQGPMNVGSLPFPTPFFFPDGQTCVNFNQLALACDNRWDEARALLGEGVWSTFFRGMGRLDLAAAAKQGAAEPDLDRGLSLMLEKLPADPDTLRPPKLAVESREENLGHLSPGIDLKFDIVILNEGMFLLRGVILSNSEWLVFGDHGAPAERMFQTRNTCSIGVRVLGGKLRAGLKPLLGEFVIDSNGGTLTVPVRAEVPIRPFPRGVNANDSLAGSSSPREVARKAKEFPNEAAILFAEGAVKAWYASNGWTYPIEGSEGSGKGAVQQFFEALGLTKAPPLEISTTSLKLRGKIGERLTKTVTVRTEESKPVYAAAWSNQDWVNLRPVKYLGNKVEIPIEITVPAKSGQTAEARVTIRGNGKQQFVVEVSVTIEKEIVPIMSKPAGARRDERAAHGEEERAGWAVPLWAWFGCGFVVAGFFVVLAMVVALVVRNLW